MDEFEVMRRQLASMKSQLDTQEIVNKKLMCKVMRGKASWMNILVKSELIALPFIYLMLVGICYAYGISQWFSFVFLVFGGIDAILDLRTVRIPTDLFSTSSIVDLRRFLIRQMKERFVQTCVSGVLAIAWLILFVCALATAENTLSSYDVAWDYAMRVGLVGGIVGAVIAVIVIVALYRKMQRTNHQIIADIDELENETD